MKEKANKVKKSGIRPPREKDANTANFISTSSPALIIIIRFTFFSKQHFLISRLHE
jgi:hypothetical protein